MHALHHFVLLLYLSPSNTGRSGIEYPLTTVLFYAWCLVHAISISIPLVLLHAYGLYMYAHWQQMTIMIACNIATILKDTCMKRHSLVPSVYSVHDSQACSNFEKAFFYLISLCLINCCNFCVQNECIHRDTKLVYIMLTNSSSSVFSTVECHAKDGCHILPLECQSLYVVTSLFCSLLAVTCSWGNSHTRWRQFNNFTNVGAGRTSTLKHGKQNYGNQLLHAGTVLPVVVPYFCEHNFCESPSIGITKICNF